MAMHRASTSECSRVQTKLCRGPAWSASPLFETYLLLRDCSPQRARAVLAALEVVVAKGFTSMRITQYGCEVMEAS
eukprot:10231021-Alexandrium_andersonii.AAC.1